MKATENQTQVPKQSINSTESFSDPLLSQKASTKRLSIGLSMRKSKARYFALAMAALLMFGNNYSFDNPQALQTQIMTDLQISNPQYNLLYSAFSFPNIFLTLVGGFMIDFLGVRFGIFCFCTGVLMAQLVVAIGGTFKVYLVMLVGRAFFGICSENLIIAQSAIVSKWFKGSELSMAIGIIMTVPELGSAFNSLLSPLFYKASGSLALPLFVSVGICMFSLLCAIALVLLDRKADQQEINLEENGEEQSPEKVSFEDIKQFSATFWILVSICMLTLGVYIPFLDDANDFYQKKFGYSSISAGQVLMIPYLTSIIASLFIGKYVDKIGKRRYLILVTAGLYFVAHMLFGLLKRGEEEAPNYWSIIPLFIFGTHKMVLFSGIGYASYSCVLIPCVQYVVEQRVMGTAFGIMGMFESIALASFPIITSSIVSSSKDEAKGYTNVGFFFAGIAIIAALLGSSLFFFDQKGSVFLDFINPDEPNKQEQLLLDKHKTKEYDEESEDDNDDDDDDDEENHEEEEEEEEENYLNYNVDKNYTTLRKENELKEFKETDSNLRK